MVTKNIVSRQVYSVAPSLVLFAESFVKIFNHSYDYAEKFMPCSPQKLLRLIQYHTLDKTLGLIHSPVNLIP